MNITFDPMLPAERNAISALLGILNATPVEGLVAAQVPPVAAPPAQPAQAEQPTAAPTKPRGRPPKAKVEEPVAAPVAAEPAPQAAPADAEPVRSSDPKMAETQTAFSTALANVPKAEPVKPVDTFAGEPGRQKVKAQIIAWAGKAGNSMDAAVEKLSALGYPTLAAVPEDQRAEVWAAFQ